jgi:hypothetical protein
MITSETLTKIAPGYLAAQRVFKNAAKNATGQVGQQRYGYANLDAVLDVKDVLNDNDIICIQLPSFPENALAGYLYLDTRLLHVSGEWIEGTAGCPLPKGDPQGYGSAMTYVRRQSLMAACGITQGVDDDGAAASPHTQSRDQKPTSQQPKPQATQQQAAAAYDAGAVPPVSAGTDTIGALKAKLHKGLKGFDADGRAGWDRWIASSFAGKKFIELDGSQLAKLDAQMYPPPAKGA